MNITVYMASSFGNDQEIKKGAEELGRWIAENGNTLVYGGSESGLMGVTADAALKRNGRVIGVEPQFFIDMGYEHHGITELIITNDIPERRKKMLELGDAFIALPGGTGTLEEISEIMSNTALGFIKAPCIFFNINHFYDFLKQQIEHMVETGLFSEKGYRLINFCDSIEEIDKCIKSFKEQENVI